MTWYAAGIGTRAHYYYNKASAREKSRAATAVVYEKAGWARVAVGCVAGGSVSNLWRPVVREMRAITVLRRRTIIREHTPPRHLTRPFNKN